MPEQTLTTLLRQHGFETEALQRAVQPVLRGQGIILKGRYRLDVPAQQRVEQCLEKHVLRHCAHPTCVALAVARAYSRTPLAVTAPSCAICAGSSQRRVVRQLYAALTGRGLTRLLVVGGAPRPQQLLHDLAGDEGIALRTIDGSGRAHSQREAAPHVSWAQVLVIWGGTPLSHKVSIVYDQCPPPPMKVIIGRPGLEALCQGVLAAVKTQAAGIQRQAA